MVNFGTTEEGKASMLSRETAPSPEPGLTKHKLNRSFVSPSVNTSLRSTFGVNADFRKAEIINIFSSAMLDFSTFRDGKC